MDITVKVKTRQGEFKSHSFIGDKEQILPKIQEYIKDNKHHYIVFFVVWKTSRDELFRKDCGRLSYLTLMKIKSRTITQELFNP
jgi:hypothetical protein